MHFLGGRADIFAKKLCRILQKARTENLLNDLVLVSEPHFLGLLLSTLDAQTLKLLSAKVEKDLGYYTDAEAKDYLCNLNIGQAS